jgi:hypothetical protein
MMIIHVPACLEGRFLSILVSLKINPLLIRSTIDKSNLAGTSDTVGTGNFICGVDLEFLHPPDGTLRDRSTNGINTGLLSKETKPPPPPEPPPIFYNIHQKLNTNVMVYIDPPIFNHSSKFKGKDIRWKLQSIVPYNYNEYQCIVLIGWEMGRLPTNS